MGKGGSCGQRWVKWAKVGHVGKCGSRGQRWVTWAKVGHVGKGLRFKFWLVEIIHVIQLVISQLKTFKHKIVEYANSCYTEVCVEYLLI